MGWIIASSERISKPEVSQVFYCPWMCSAALFIVPPAEVYSPLTSSLRFEGFDGVLSGFFLFLQARACGQARLAICSARIQPCTCLALGDDVMSAAAPSKSHTAYVNNNMCRDVKRHFVALSPCDDTGTATLLEFSVCVVRCWLLQARQDQCT